MTAGGSSIPEVQLVLMELAASRCCAEAGTAFGEGAAAMARTAKSVVTVEVDPDRIEIARERLRGLPNVELLEGGWKELLPPRAPFDLFFLDAGGIKQSPQETYPRHSICSRREASCSWTTSPRAAPATRRARRSTRIRSSTSPSTSFEAPG